MADGNTPYAKMSCTACREKLSSTLLYGHHAKNTANAAASTGDVPHIFSRARCPVKAVIPHERISLRPTLFPLTHMSTKPAKPSGPSGPVRFYLVVYNLLCFVGWLRIFVSLIVFMVMGKLSYTPLYPAVERLLEHVRPVVAAIAPPQFTNVPEPIAMLLTRASNVHAHLGSLALVFQSLAVIEFLNALFGLVQSNPIMVLVQVFSRLAVLWAVVEPYPAAAHSPFYALLLFAWSFSEIVRYPFYVNQLLDSQSYMALWGRYTWFIVLYPIGVISEIALILATLPLDRQWPWIDATGWSPRDLLFLALIPLYIPGLTVLYTRLLAQRRKVLGNDFVGSKGLEEIRKRREVFNARLRRPLGGTQFKTE